MGMSEIFLEIYLLLNYFCLKENMNELFQKGIDVFLDQEKEQINQDGSEENKNNSSERKELTRELAVSMYE